MSSESVTPLSSERPFLGLKPYGYPERDYFFGRKTQSFTLYNLVQRNPFVAVVGSSGSGKSSLVRAGLRAILEDEKKIGDLKWIWLEMRPGDAPLTRLVNLITGLADQDPSITQAQKERMAFELRQSSFGIVRALERLNDFGTNPIVLLVDQFEELFRFNELSTRPGASTGPRNEAAHFVQLLLEASRDRRCNVHVLLTMRSDFIGECARFRGLPEVVSAAQFLVPSLTRDQTEDVIRKPLENAGASIDPMLVERLLIDSGTETDQLPVLQHCLLRLWNEAKHNTSEQAAAPTEEGNDTSPSRPALGRHITAKHYENVGGIAKALSQHAEEIYTSLSDVRIAVEQTFRALAEFDREGRIIRRSRHYGELRDETGVDESDLQRVLKHFTADDCSFLTATPAEWPDETRIDVGHEALLRHWERVSGTTGAIESVGGRKHPGTEGWLKAEERDGQRYRGLVSLIENEEEPDASFVKEADKRWAWWTSRKRTSAWADRHGGHFLEVENLLRDGVRRKERLVWRNRGIATAASVLLLAGLTLGYKAYEGVQSAQRAEHNFSLALRSARSVLDTVGATLDRGLLSVEGAKSLLATADKIVHEAASTTAGPVVTKLKIDLLTQGSDISVRILSWADALKRAEAARSEAHRLVLQEPNDLNWQYLEFEGLQRAATARVNFDSNTATQVLAELLEAKEMIRGVIGAAPVPDRRQRLIFVRNLISDVMMIKSDLDGAITELLETLAFVDSLRNKEPNSRQWLREAANTKDRLGTAYLVKRDFASALTTQKEALALRIALASRSDDSSLVANVALSYDKIGGVYDKQRDFEKALAEYEAALRIREELVDRDPGNALWQNYAATSYNHVGNAAAALGQIEKARDSYRKLTVKRQLLAARDPSDRVRLRSWAASVAVLAGYENVQGKYAAAAEAYRTLIPAYVTQLRSNPKDQELRRSQVDNYIKIGDSVMLQGDREVARKEYETALGLAQAGVSEFAGDLTWQRNLGVASEKIGGTYEAAGNTEEALKSYRQAVTLFEPLASGDKAVARLRERTLERIGKLTAAN